MSHYNNRGLRQGKLFICMCARLKKTINLIKNGITRLKAKCKAPLTQLFPVIVLDICSSLLQIYQSGRGKCIQSGTTNS